MTNNFGTSRIAVIGANGYLGSSLVQKLVEIGCQVIRVSKVHTSSIPGTISLTGNMMNANFCETVVKNSDIIYYLSGNTSVHDAAKNPDENYQSTVLPITNIIEASKVTQKVPKLIFASTATVYGLTPNLPIDETYLFYPKTVYDKHKCIAENFIISANSSGILHGTSMRLSNVYGPSLRNNSSNDRGVVNKTLIQALQGKNLKIFGSGKYIRDYIYISDVIDSFIHVGGQKDITHNLFNVGTGVGTTIKNLYETIAKLVQIKTGKVISLEFHPFPDNSSLIDERNFTSNISRLSAATGWYPRYNLIKGLETFLDSV
jgi:nucleoside-diphosphate-sugar epimerase